MKTAMILAAGRGERLRPITDTTPKALVKVHGLPLIIHHINHLAKAGFEHIVVNHAWLGGKIRQTLGNGQHWGVEICYSAEPPGGLETGGGILQALPFLGTEPFITVNADIYSDYDFATLSLSEQKMAKLILVAKPPYFKQGDFGLTTQHTVSNDNRLYTFAGIACYKPSIFSSFRTGRYSVVPMLRSLADINQLEGEIHHGSWTDVGSPERFMEANAVTDASICDVK